MPTLIVFGDYLPSATGLPLPNWQERFDDCRAYVGRIKAAQGNAQILYPSDVGIKGNTHMIMQDKNNT